MPGKCEVLTAKLDVTLSNARPVDVCKGVAICSHTVATLGVKQNASQTYPLLAQTSVSEGPVIARRYILCQSR